MHSYVTLLNTSVFLSVLQGLAGHNTRVVDFLHSTVAVKVCSSIRKDCCIL
ncbi:uncharacterized protein DEA37_0003111 [Paragonimus westermani]|uniref:Uncharacterized protein n=1 Tax=Paragonimus westermani TaxID=34504 RepID=A0A5J4NYR4_9TREM|nr:uncharacterized protein DEA37_0003111 [Paragonimus westermani]